MAVNRSEPCLALNIDKWQNWWGVAGKKKLSQGEERHSRLLKFLSFDLPSTVKLSRSPLVLAGNVVQSSSLRVERAQGICVCVQIPFLAPVQLKKGFFFFFFVQFGKNNPVRRLAVYWKHFSVRAWLRHCIAPRIFYASLRALIEEGKQHCGHCSLGSAWAQVKADDIESFADHGVGGP